MQVFLIDLEVSTNTPEPRIMHWKPPKDLMATVRLAVSSLWFRLFHMGTPRKARFLIYGLRARCVFMLAALEKDNFSRT